MILISDAEYNQLSWKCTNNPSQKEIACRSTDPTPPNYPPTHDDVDTAAPELFKIHATTTKSDGELDTEIGVRLEPALGRRYEPDPRCRQCYSPRPSSHPPSRRPVSPPQTQPWIRTISELWQKW